MSGLRHVMETILAQAMSRESSSTPPSRRTRTDEGFWRIRENVGEAQTPCRRLDQARHLGAGRGGARFSRGSQAAVTALIPGARPLPFGHLGDGNIHYNVTQPIGADKADYLKRWDEVNAACSPS